MLHLPAQLNWILSWRNVNVHKLEFTIVNYFFGMFQVSSMTQKRRPESIMSEMELNNIIVEQLIEYVDDIFA